VLVPEDVGADQPTVIFPSPGLRPVTVGALGESPKVSAPLIVDVPALVVTETSTVPPEGEAGLVNIRVLPELDSAQLFTGITPTDIPVTPTKKLPFTVTDAPPVLGIKDLSVLVADGA
jgi:hypothetical protein